MCYCIMCSLFLSKHRPKKLDDIVGNTDIIDYLKISSKRGEISNMIFVGESGNGKTITAECLIKEITNDYFILNAYDDRNQNSFKKVIGSFAKKKTNGKKIVLIDEIDSLIDSTQSVLSLFMEMDDIKFILTCNRLDNLIESVQNKSIIYRFNNIKENEIYSYLETLCSIENIIHDKEGLEALVFSANGDLRIAVNNLNITYHGYKQITNTNVFKICNIPELSLLQILVDTLLKKDLEKVMLLTNRFSKMGYNQIDIITYLFSIVNIYDMDEKIRIVYLSKINKSLYRLSSLCTDLQLYYLFITLIE